MDDKARLPDTDTTSAKWMEVVADVKMKANVVCLILHVPPPPSCWRPSSWCTNSCPAPPHSITGSGIIFVAMLFSTGSVIGHCTHTRYFLAILKFI